LCGLFSDDCRCYPFFEAVGTEVNLVDGVIGNDMDAMFGAKIIVTGGTIGYGLEAHRGSAINIDGSTGSRNYDACR